MIERIYIIRGLREYNDDGNSLYWSNDIGWVDRSSATEFTEAQMASLNLPIDGQWEYRLRPTEQEAST